jgi:hypothetical protein
MVQKIITPVQFFFGTFPTITIFFSIIIIVIVACIALDTIYFVSVKKVDAIVDTAGDKQPIYITSSIHKNTLIASIAAAVVGIILFIIILVRYHRIFGSDVRNPYYIGCAILGVLLLVDIIVSTVFLMKKYPRCPSGSYFSETEGLCVDGCTDASDCSDGASCKNNQCCPKNHYICDNDPCCDRPCINHEGKKNWCCDQVCDISGGFICCPTGTVCDTEKKACLSKCGNNNCDVNETCVMLPVDDANKFQFSDKSSYEDGILYSCVARPMEGQCSNKKSDNFIPETVNNFKPCFNSNSIKDVNDILENTRTDLTDVKKKLYGTDQNSYICGQSPSARFVQSKFTKNCSPLKCLGELNTDTINMGISRDNDGTIYCNQLLNCNNKLLSSKLSTYTTKDVITDKNGNIKLEIKENRIKNLHNLLKAGGKKDEYQKDCNVFKDITDKDGPCTGTTIEGHNCKIVNGNGYIVNTNPPPLKKWACLTDNNGTANCEYTSDFTDPKYTGAYDDEKTCKKNCCEYGRKPSSTECNQVLHWDNPLYLKGNNLFIDGSYITKDCDKLGGLDKYKIKSDNKKDGDPILIGDPIYFVQARNQKKYFFGGHGSGAKTTYNKIAFTSQGKSGPMAYGDELNIRVVDTGKCWKFMNPPGEGKGIYTLIAG